jgi:hypothetical protein
MTILNDLIMCSKVDCVRFSADGKYLAILTLHTLQVTDAETWGLVSYIFFHSFLLGCLSDCNLTCLIF